MARPLVLSNGRLMVGLDEHGLVHDFYYPYVGQDNLTTARSVHHKIGIWVDNHFTWVDDGSWTISTNFEENALITAVSMVSESLNIPTIGIGAGGDCDGQVLVMHDMLGINTEFKPRFLRQYLNIYEQSTKAVQQYISDVKAKRFSK